MFTNEKYLRLFLWLGALFYVIEAFLHFFGLPILEHDQIFLYTHDRYIALFALTYAVLLVLISTDFARYKILFYFTMSLIFLSMLTAYSIAALGGYNDIFPVIHLDSDLPVLGYVFLGWYVVVWIFFMKFARSYTKKMSV